MADRGTESEPLAPRRSLGKTDDDQSSATSEEAKPARRSRRSTSSSSTTKSTAEKPTATTKSASPTAAAAGAASVSPGASGSTPTRATDADSGTRSTGRPAGSDTNEKQPVGERVSSALTRTGENLKAVTASAAAAAQAAAAPTSQGRPVRRTRRARLRMVRLDPWSVMKTSFLLSIAFGIVTVVAVGIVWGVLGAAGVWDSIDSTVQQVIGGDNQQASFHVQDYLGTSRVMGFTMLVAVVDVILITAIATLTAFLYNLAAALLGGIEMTLAEDDR